jgi:hypothetical protein
MSALTGRGAEITTVIALFGLVAVLGFGAARWRRAPAQGEAHAWDLEEWGLGGRAFGGTVTFFLVGGDLYTAYTLVAVPTGRISERSVTASQLASTFGMISSFSRFMSSSVFETGTSAKGGQRSGIVSPASW